MSGLSGRGHRGGSGAPVNVVGSTHPADLNVFLVVFFLRGDPPQKTWTAVTHSAHGGVVQS